ncbi:Pentatricopeptide repeat - like 10 [Theobroma cacao]|nr:Pentatricopeptide repeat - like 10 [Theobroma cacao]
MYKFDNCYMLEEKIQFILVVCPCQRTKLPFLHKKLYPLSSEGIKTEHFMLYTSKSSKKNLHSTINSYGDMHSLPRFSCLPLLNLKSPIASHHIKQIHAQLIINGLKEPSFLAKLIENYCFSPSPQNTKYAQLVNKQFDTQSLFLFNTLLRCSQPKVSIITFANWVSKGHLVFDDFTFIFVLGACARSHSLSTLWLGRQIHVKALKFGVMSNLLVETTLIHFYAKNKDILSARRVFDEMTERSSVTWNAIVKGYCSQKERAKECCREALVLFRDMLNDVSGVKPTDTTMANESEKCFDLDCHGNWVSCSWERGRSFGAFGCNGGAGHLNEAYDFIIEMPMKPDAIFWRSLLSACNVHGDVVMAEKVGKILLRLKPPNSYVDMATTSEDYVALSNVYASAGRWQQVEMVRKKMKLKRVETEPGGSSIQTISNHLDRL